MRQMVCFSKLVVILPLLLILISFPLSNSTFCQTKSKNNTKLKLKSLTPSLDKSKPVALSKLRLTGRVQDSFNPSLIAIPKSGSVNAYEAGLKLFKSGDYDRAMTAFKIALIRASKFGTRDARYKTALSAINTTSKKLNMQARLGYKTDNPNKDALTGKVTKVFPPSLAWLGGLKVNDQILQSKVSKNTVRLKVQRGSKVYGLTLRLDKENNLNLKSLVPKTAKVPQSGPYLKGKINHPELLIKEERRLSSYDCILMLDCSGSMGDRIVSLGKVNGKLTTRWNWCKRQMLTLYDKGAPYFPEGITLVPFANKFAIINEARQNEIHQMFRQLSPVGGTNMALPLSFIIDDYFRRKRRNQGRVKPIVIAVLSDGEGNAHILRQLIIKTTHRMTTPREIIITFLAVDATALGRPVIEALDNNLYNAGAKYDIVDSRSFEELRKYGLMKMLVAALIEPYVERK